MSRWQVSWQQDPNSFARTVQAENQGRNDSTLGQAHCMRAQPLAGTPTATSLEEHAGQQEAGLRLSRQRREASVTWSWGADGCLLAMLTWTAHAQGSGKQGGASSGSGSQAEWRSFNDKFLCLVRLHSLHHGS